MTLELSHSCDFCGKTKDEVERLIVGHTSAICDGCVELCVSILEEDKIKKFPKDPAVKQYNPAKIKEYLDEWIIGQTQAKIAVSVSVCQHYKRINNKSKDIQLDKSNVLLLGPSGVGKTLIAQKLAEYLDVPFAMADATSLTEAGYVGDDVESILGRLLIKADGDIERAQKGIVYIDEVDKISRRGENSSSGRDIGGEGVQQALLKLIEGSVVSVPTGEKHKKSRSETIEIDTRNILFICGGAFVGLDKHINKRSKETGIGFSASVKSTKETTSYSKVSTKDLINYGLIPEFIGRFSLIVGLEELTTHDLVRILREPRNSLIAQYKYLFELSGVKLVFEDEALQQIAVLAKQTETNARALKNILEKLLLSYQFDLDSLVERGLTKIIINKETVLGKPATMIFDQEKIEKRV